MNRVLNKRNLLASKLRSEVSVLFETLVDIDLYRFNKNSKYKWGYSSSTYIISIFMKKSFLKSFVVHNIKKLDNFIKILDDQDHRIFEAIQEASSWIEYETEIIEKKIQDFSSNYLSSKNRTEEVLEAYRSLKRRET